MRARCVVSSNSAAAVKLGSWIILGFYIVVQITSISRHANYDAHSPPGQGMLGANRNVFRQMKATSTYLSIILILPGLLILQLPHGRLPRVLQNDSF